MLWGAVPVPVRATFIFTGKSIFGVFKVGNFPCSGEFGVEKISGKDSVEPSPKLKPTRKNSTSGTKNREHKKHKPPKRFPKYSIIQS